MFLSSSSQTSSLDTASGPVEFDPELIAGPLIIGACVATLLVGAILAQCYLYFQEYSKDRRLIRYVVSIICLAELTSFCLAVSLLYLTFCTYYGNPRVFTHFPAQYGAVFILSSVIQASVQGLFILRVKVLTRRAYVYLPCTLLSAYRVAALFALGCIAATSPKADEALRKWSWLILSMIITATSGDLCIAISLSVCLWKKKQGNFTISRDLINRLLRFVIQTGILTSVTTISILITFLLFKRTWIWIGLSVIVSRVYSISLLGSLNGRSRSRLHQTNMSTPPSPSVWDTDVQREESRNALFSTRLQDSRQVPISIEMETDTCVDGASLRENILTKLPAKGDV